MKLKLVLATLLAFLVIGVGSASAWWYMPYRLAKNATREYAVETCGGGCVGAAAGPCRRFSQSRFDCVEIQSYAFLPPAPAEEAEEFDCYTLLHWGVNYSGRVALKGKGQPRCYTA